MHARPTLPVIPFSTAPTLYVVSASLFSSHLGCSGSIKVRVGGSKKGINGLHPNACGLRLIRFFTRGDKSIQCAIINVLGANNLRGDYSVHVACRCAVLFQSFQNVPLDCLHAILVADSEQGEELLAAVCALF